MKFTPFTPKSREERPVQETSDEPLAMMGDYCGLKFVQGRKCAQIIVEIPIERATAFVNAFGTPDSANPIKVAIARLLQK